MSTSTLLLKQATNGEAQVTPSRFPAEITIIFEPQGEAEAYYGVDGQAPSIKLQRGVSKVIINVNSLQLAY
jgi:hypothetical protein